MDEDQKKVQTLSQLLQTIQDDMQSAIAARQTLESQSAENLAVQKEFKSLSDDADIYKLVGPVLLKQDKVEANNAVNGRLEFIGKEITRTEAKIKELQTEAESKRGELMAAQQKMQVAAQGQQTTG